MITTNIPKTYLVKSVELENGEYYHKKFESHVKRATLQDIPENQVYRLVIQTWNGKTNDLYYTKTAIGEAMLRVQWNLINKELPV